MRRKVGGEAVLPSRIADEVLDAPMDHSPIALGLCGIAPRTDPAPKCPCSRFIKLYAATFMAVIVTAGPAARDERSKAELAGI